MEYESITYDNAIASSSRASAYPAQEHGDCGLPYSDCDDPRFMANGMPRLGAELCLKTLEEARQNGQWYLGRGRGTGAMYGSETHELADYPFAVPAGTRPPEIPVADHKVNAPLTNAQA